MSELILMVFVNNNDMTYKWVLYHCQSSSRGWTVFFIFSIKWFMIWWMIKQHQDWCFRKAAILSRLEKIPVPAEGTLADEQWLPNWVKIVIKIEVVVTVAGRDLVKRIRKKLFQKEESREKKIIQWSSVATHFSNTINSNSWSQQEARIRA